MTGVTYEVRVLEAADWATLQRIRLRALRSSPDAFAPTDGREERWTAPEWVEAVRTATWIVAFSGCSEIGLLKSTRDPRRPWTRWIESAWVAPGHRRRGVLRSVFAEALREAGTEARQLEVWVFEDNPAAWTAYTQLGFEPTSDRQLLNGRWERRLRWIVM